jgi:hypothetical protein
MKKLFAEYVPVEGKIKKGDKVTHPSFLSLGVMEALTDNEGTKLKSSGGTKVELFLCSRYIQVGDKFDSANGSNFLCSKVDENYVYSIGGLQHPLEEVKHSMKWSFKVLGKISPQAKWVKRGDEFDKYEVEWDHKQYIYDGIGHYLIKGPCTHFH